VSDGLAVVVVTHDSEAHLPALLHKLSRQLGPGDELVVVDNISTDDSVGVARRSGAPVRLIETGANLGFGGGCHVGADASHAPLLCFINPDSEPAPGCLDALRAAAGRHPRWGAWQAAVMLDAERINTDGGVVHFLGMGWAGHCGAPAAALPQQATEPAFPSGAAMVIRRTTWDRLAGFDSSYFLYGEDLELGLRVWLSGEGVGMVPEARVVHRYDFDKGTHKWFYLERNRWRTILSVYPGALLALLAPALLAGELALLALAARQGWLRAKLSSQRAVLGELGVIRSRRRRIQAMARIDAIAFADHLTANVESPYLPGSGPVTVLPRVYWAAVRLALKCVARCTSASTSSS
jgi:N-acetylglucosaminyl-diphospho-decaprenol L-rhamnosyltransferase